MPKSTKRIEYAVIMVLIGVVLCAVLAQLGRVAEGEIEMRKAIVMIADTSEMRSERRKWEEKMHAALRFGRSSR